jgi:4-hydroxythreonine-4-phosphate dehydrogenase
MGDPSGIGPEITLKALHKLKGLADFTIIGDKWVLNQIPNPKSQIPNYTLVDLDNVDHKGFSFGKVRAEYGRASVEYLDKALELLRKKEIGCLVTAPLSKEAVSLTGRKGFRGHTEYLAEACGTKDFVMLLLNRDLKISLVTRHSPLKEVARRLKQEEIIKNIKLTYQALKKLFAIAEPRLVICGLNPHASDNGLLGEEENKIIKPALKKLKPRIKNLCGPLPADVAIAGAYKKKYDCAVAMYHDQALIPLKLLGDNQGVNMTLGLPFVRTSPLHGTAFDIAGGNAACPDSLIEAIKLAVRCSRNLKKT